MSKHEELIERMMNVPCYTEEDAKALAAIADALEAQARETEGLRKDAERLDWLERLWDPNPDYGYGNIGGNLDLPTVNGAKSTSFRDAIDYMLTQDGAKDG